MSLGGAAGEPGRTKSAFEFDSRGSLALGDFKALTAAEGSARRRCRASG
jgi:hypothetical protein